MLRAMHNSISLSFTSLHKFIKDTTTHTHTAYFVRVICRLCHTRMTRVNTSLLTERKRGRTWFGKHDVHPSTCMACCLSTDKNMCVSHSRIIHSVICHTFSPTFLLLLFYLTIFLHLQFFFFFLNTILYNHYRIILLDTDIPYANLNKMHLQQYVCTYTMF